MLDLNSAGESIHLIEGAVGKLEIALTVPAEIKYPELAIICHPHPLFEGTMTNKVVHTLAKTFRDLGCIAVRFNFRGVGNSEGLYGEGIGETEDLLALLQYFKTLKPEAVFLLNGFSFGSYVAYRASSLYAKEFPIKHLITVAPAVEHFDFKTLPVVECPWLLIQGEADEVVDPKSVFNWVEELTVKPRVIRFPNVGHFFHGELVKLRSMILHYFAAGHWL
ncbi:MAG: alpha/beta hydrolase [Legionellales bacterium]|nr:alpha/beta hydrolase [Legionellales bacterium]